MKREPTQRERLLKTATFAVKQSDDAQRTIEHVITARTVDRDGDVVEPKGVRTENFLNNPVVLLGHSSWGFPVGRCLGLTVSAADIVAVTQFAGLDQAAPEAETAYRLARDGFMNAWSIGFMPITWSEDKALPGQDGWWFKETELYEYSLVAIPSNPEALSRMAKGLALPSGASEDDFLDAVKKDRKRYFDVGAALLVNPDAPLRRAPIGTLVRRVPRRKALAAEVSSAILAALASLYEAVVASMKAGDGPTADALSALADSLVDVANQEPEVEPAPAGGDEGWPTEPTPSPAGPTITSANGHHTKRGAVVAQRNLVRLQAAQSHLAEAGDHHGYAAKCIGNAAEQIKAVMDDGSAEDTPSAPDAMASAVADVFKELHGAGR